MNDAKKKIAVIEDDRNLLELLKKILTNEGYEVLGAPTGSDLAKKVIDNKPDLIITDLGLPLLAGEKVIEVFQKKDIDYMVPVIVMSAKEEWEIKEAAEHIGAVKYLEKPVNPEELLELIRKYI
ncbi:MAG: hypothetical protein A3J83_00775 [Elusimicrobia bacterium RIFOXYA2_FULL_40_6]|nr:MAG: hypothetical protein A3J83_00775 [Elusimicrobia bacterium RIFOXYA2_FULL_40_6]